MIPAHLWSSLDSPASQSNSAHGALEPLSSAVDIPLFVITDNFESHTNSEVATAALQDCVGDMCLSNPVMVYSETLFMLQTCFIHSCVLDHLVNHNKQTLGVCTAVTSI